MSGLSTLNVGFVYPRSPPLLRRLRGSKTYVHFKSICMKNISTCLASALLCVFVLNGSVLRAQTTAFITTWNTDDAGFSNSTSIIIPTFGSGYNYDVDWDNDGIYDELGITGDATHDFSLPGLYTIRIRGDFPRIFFNGSGDRLKIRDVVQWGNIAWISMASAFLGCINLNISATDVPDLSGVSSMNSMFRNCSSLVGPANMNSWNTSTVTDMTNLFIGAQSFNQNIGNWNTENVTAMASMFGNAAAFNQNISAWNTGNVTSMTNMFNGALSFNQDISSWNVANVTIMSNMFSNASAFNQNLGSWALKTGVTIVGMLNNSGMNCTNYSSTLAGWANNPLTPTGRSLGATGRRYGTNAVTARARLTSSTSSGGKGWIISGDANNGTACGTAALPVELLSFAGQEQENTTVLLTWQTASEYNNKGFYVERSADGRSWRPLDFVPGQGNNSETSSYAYTDHLPFSGINYYRLQQLDLDEQTVYSAVIQVHVQTDGAGVRVFPNPARDAVTLVLPKDFAGEAVLNVYDPAGRVVKTATRDLESASDLTLDLSNLPEGIYLMEVKTGQQQWQERLVVRR